MSSLHLEKMDVEKALNLCEEYTLKHAVTQNKSSNDRQYFEDKKRGMREWEDFAKEQEPAFDEIQELALAKARQLHDTFASLQDVQFQVDRIESDAWLDDKAYPVPLFIAGDTTPADDN